MENTPEQTVNTSTDSEEINKNGLSLKDLGTIINTTYFVGLALLAVISIGYRSSVQKMQNEIKTSLKNAIVAEAPLPNQNTENFSISDLDIYEEDVSPVTDTESAIFRNEAPSYRHTEDAFANRSIVDEDIEE